MQHITDKLDVIIGKLDAELLKLQVEGAATQPEEEKEVKTSEELTNEDSHRNTTVALKDNSGHKMDVQDGDDRHKAKPCPDAQNESDLSSRSSDCNDLELAQSTEEINNQSSFSPHSVEEGAEKDKDKQEKNSKWVIVG